MSDPIIMHNQHNVNPAAGVASSSDSAPCAEEISPQWQQSSSKPVPGSPATPAALFEDDEEIRYLAGRMLVSEIEEVLGTEIGEEPEEEAAPSCFYHVNGRLLPTAGEVVNAILAGTLIIGWGCPHSGESRLKCSSCCEVE